MDKTVIELFAGVGGFRVGLERLKKENIEWETVFASQWEPSKKNQFAFNCYNEHFGSTTSFNSNQDINDVESKKIPEHTLLVGGFPCQDYSVATTSAKGLEGKKGVLWWEIHRILRDKKTPYILLENVDRLLKSPTSQRGRDFMVMLKCLDNLEYNVEWRVVNAADYGYNQRRRRVFIFAYKREVDNKITRRSKLFKAFDQIEENNDKVSFIQANGFFNKIFESDLDYKKKKYIFNFNLQDKNSKYYTEEFHDDIQTISDEYNEGMLRNNGVMINGQVFSYDILPKMRKQAKLKDILIKTNVDEEFFLNSNKEERMKKAKGSKSIQRTTSDGHKYNYSEGQMSYPENLDLPGRTMLTSEGTINRSTHVVKDLETGKHRFITPIEAERLNGFDDDWTKGMTKSERYFCMGNALVTNLITEMGREISKIIDEEE